MAFIVVEYVARYGSRDPLRGVHYPLRQDGHYSSREGAQSVADDWAKNPLTPASFVVVAEIVSTVRKP